MAQIIRTPTRADGGVTEKEKAKLDAIAQKWIQIAYRTEPIDKDKITDAITRLYAAADLKTPRIVIVPSPFVGRLAAGIASAVWHLRKNGHGRSAKQATIEATRTATRTATHAATDAATYAATHAATYAATAAATDAATDAATAAATAAATYAATHAATHAATYAATAAATRTATRTATKTHWLKALIQQFTPNNKKLTLNCIEDAWKLYQGGNMWAYWSAYAEGMRDVIGLTGLPVWEKYQAWEDASKEGGLRYIHEEFCIVSDFPELIQVNDRYQPHCATGPSHRWRDGFEIYHLNGVRFTKEQFEKATSGTLTLKGLMEFEDIDQRTQALRFCKPGVMIEHAKGELIDEVHKIATDGTLVTWKLYKFPSGEIFAEDAYYCLMDCPSTGKQHFEGVEKCNTVAEAMSWAEWGMISPEQWLLRVPLRDEN